MFGTSLASKIIPIVDLHADLPWDITNRRTSSREPVSYSVLDRYHLRKLREGGIAGLNSVIWVESSYKYHDALSRGLTIIDCTIEDVLASRGFEIATTGTQFRSIMDKSEKIAVILGIEGGELIEDNLSLLRIFHRLGVRSFGFVWNERNLLGDGYSEINRRNGGSGLSELGIKVVEECNRLGIIVDGAHITPNGLLDILETSRKPIIVSHASTMAHNGTLRPVSDEHLKRIAANGGVVAIFAVNRSGSIPTLDSYVDHVEYAIRTAGIEHVGLGFDYVDYIPENQLAVPPTAEAVLDLESHDKSQAVIESLRARGYKDEDIERIAHRNFLRVLDEITR